MSEKYPGFFTAIFGGRRVTQPEPVKPKKRKRRKKPREPEQLPEEPASEQPEVEEE